MGAPVLVAYATKYGSSQEVADIASERARCQGSHQWPGE